MVCNTHYYKASELCPSSGFLRTDNTTFRKLDLFPSSGEGGRSPTLQKNQKLAFPQAMPEQRKVDHKPPYHDEIKVVELIFHPSLPHIFMKLFLIIQVQEQIYILSEYNKKQTHSVAFSSQANYTDREADTCRRSANFCGSKGMTWSAHRVPTAINPSFRDRI
jgi:hypothetical protein